MNTKMNLKRSPSPSPSLPGTRQLRLSSSNDVNLLHVQQVVLSHTAKRSGVSGNGLVDDAIFQNSRDKENALSPRLLHVPSPLAGHNFLKVSPRLMKQLHAAGADTSEERLIRLGKGSFGTVVLGNLKGQRVAIKILSRSRMAHRRKQMLDNELNATRLEHRNIVQVIGVWVPDSESDPALIMMEYVGRSSLQTMVEQHPECLTLAFLQDVFIQVSSALAYCHDQGIVHLDLKPSNVLLTSSQGPCKLADFGCSRNIRCLTSSPLLGTPGFQAPELLMNGIPTTKCDVFSLGVFMWQLLSKQLMPFPGLHMHSIIFKVVSESHRPDESHVAPDTPQIFIAVYRACWHQNPERRPEARAVLSTLQRMILAKASSASKRAAHLRVR